MISLINADGVASAIQPEITGLFFLVLSFGKTWVILILGTLIALMPDFIAICVKRLLFPTPSDKVMMYLKQTNKADRDRI